MLHHIDLYIYICFWTSAQVHYGIAADICIPWPDSDSTPRKILTQFNKFVEWKLDQKVHGGSQTCTRQGLVVILRAGKVYFRVNTILFILFVFKSRDASLLIIHVIYSKHR